MFQAIWPYFGFLIIGWVTQVCWSTSNPVYHWGPWSSLPLTCSVTCGRGVRCRTRKCLDGYGKVQPTAERCSNPEDFHSKAEICFTCVVRFRCPRLPGWSSWSSWSKCMPNDNGEPEKAPNGCLVGIRVRSRKCNNPPPEAPPFGIACTGSSRQTSECSYGCDERPDIAPDNVAKQVQIQVENDYRTGMREFKTVLRKRVGERVTMDCATAAYRLAKRLVIAGIMNAAKRAFASRKVKLTWYRNGQKIHTNQPESKMPKLTFNRPGQSSINTHELLDEELRWMGLLQPSTSFIEGETLVLPSVVEGDQGFYTCELSIGDYSWVTVFYSLIIVGVRYLAQATDPFYLHSNLGFFNALSLAPVWLEAVQIVWLRNGLFQSRGLAARLSRRIQKLEHLNYTHTGTWLCFLIVPAPGPPSSVSTPFVRVSGSFLINEFHLSVRPSGTKLWQLAEYPVSIRILRNISVTLSIICLILVLFLLLTIWAARRWIHRSLSAEQTRAVVQELVDNQCRLMLTARRRAAINRDRLLPLILQEHQRLERTNRHLNERLMHMAESRPHEVELDPSHLEQLPPPPPPPPPPPKIHNEPTSGVSVHRRSYSIRKSLGDIMKNLTERVRRSIGRLSWGGKPFSSDPSGGGGRSNDPDGGDPRNSAGGGETSKFGKPGTTVLKEVGKETPLTEPEKAQVENETSPEVEAIPKRLSRENRTVRRSANLGQNEPPNRPRISSTSNKSDKPRLSGTSGPRDSVTRLVSDTNEVEVHKLSGLKPKRRGN
ncbi:Thrombospondin-2 [Fasciolopsis buskii]|uniref:Thrombospondin-2 n=1 Tax=Fasciolopsis buskii TaxID=27845 RepID=A0A8E0RW88_9TREM|nr:Thrombospondin-2 [Fasciolopsis buski]